MTPWGLLVTTFTNQPWQLLAQLQSKKDPVIPDSWSKVAPGALAPPAPVFGGWAEVHSLEGLVCSLGTHWWQSPGLR